jgi:hypothetical protein
MYVSTQNQPVSYAALFRYCGRIGGIIVMASWAVMVVADLTLKGPPAREAYVHAAVLTVVFAGYVAGWWKEVLGAVLVIGGTFALFIVCYRLQTLLTPEGLWLAAPGVFYALAHYADEKHAVQS